MEVYFLKKLILHRSDIFGRNESQNIEGCSGAKLQEPLLIPPFAPPKPISFYPSPFLSAQDQFQPIMAHFPPPFSWPKLKPNAATHFPFLFFSFLSPTCLSLPFFFSHAASLFLQPPYLLQPAHSPITFPFLLLCILPSSHLHITFPFFFSFLSPHLPIISLFFSHAAGLFLQPPYLLQPAPSPITFPFILPCKLSSPHLPITFSFFLSLFSA